MNTTPALLIEAQLAEAAASRAKPRAPAPQGVFDEILARETAPERPERFKPRAETRSEPDARRDGTRSDNTASRPAERAEPRADNTAGTQRADKADAPERRDSASDKAPASEEAAARGSETGKTDDAAAKPADASEDGAVGKGRTDTVFDEAAATAAAQGAPAETATAQAGTAPDNAAAGATAQSGNQAGEAGAAQIAATGEGGSAQTGQAAQGEGKPVGPVHPVGQDPDGADSDALKPGNGLPASDEAAQAGSKAKGAPAAETAQQATATAREHAAANAAVQQQQFATQGNGDSADEPGLERVNAGQADQLRPAARETGTGARPATTQTAFAPVNSGQTLTGSGQQQAQAQTGQQQQPALQLGQLPQATGQAEAQQVPQQLPQTPQQPMANANPLIATQELGAGAPKGEAVKIDGVLTATGEVSSRAAAAAGAEGAKTQAASRTVPLNSLATEIAAKFQAGNSRFQIRLNPPELGRIDVRLDVQSDGSTMTKLSVERPETLDMLVRDRASLERALSDAGLKSDDSTLKFSLKGENFAQHGNNGTGDADTAGGGQTGPEGHGAGESGHDSGEDEGDGEAMAYASSMLNIVV